MPSSSRVPLSRPGNELFGLGSSWVYLCHVGLDCCVRVGSSSGMCCIPFDLGSTQIIGILIHL